MSRRRSKNPTTAISITLPRALLDEIEDELTRTTSRSGWIANACRMKLKETYPQSIETRTLMAMLHARCEFDETLRTILLDRITSSNPSEEV